MRLMGDVMSRDEDGRKTRGVLSQGGAYGARLQARIMQNPVVVVKQVLDWGQFRK